MATARRRARTPLGGRTLFAIGLVLFMTIAAVVIWRRSTGIQLSNQARALETELRSIESQRVTLDRDIREASRRQRIVAEAERRLGLHVATDAQTRTLADTDSVP